MPNIYTPEQIAEMRGWVSDCMPDMSEVERVEEASEAAIVQWVAKNFCGGLRGWFIAVP